MLLELYEPAFDITLSQSPYPVMVAFVSEHCPHCVRIKPVMAALDERYRNKVNTWVVNVETAQGLGTLYANDGVPVLMGFLRGKPVWRQVGAPDPETLGKMYADLAAKGAEPGWSSFP